MYELLIVSKTNDTDGLIARVEKVLGDAQASDVKVDKLGKKQLAYAIKKESEADYTVFMFDAQGAAISDLWDMLRLEQESLLRYLIIKQKAKKVSKKKKIIAEEVKEKKTPKVTVVTKKATESEKVRESKSKVKVDNKKGAKVAGETKATKVSKVKVKSKKK